MFSWMNAGSSNTKGGLGQSQFNVGDGNDPYPATMSGRIGSTLTLNIHVCECGCLCL